MSSGIFLLSSSLIVMVLNADLFLTFWEEKAIFWFDIVLLQWLLIYIVLLQWLEQMELCLVTGVEDHSPGKWSETTHCTLSTVLCSAHKTAHCLLCTLCTSLCTLCSTLCSVHTMGCTEPLSSHSLHTHTTHHTLITTHSNAMDTSALHSVHCTLVHKCTLGVH